VTKQRNTGLIVHVLALENTGEGPVTYSKNQEVGFEDSRMGLFLPLEDPWDL